MRLAGETVLLTGAAGGIGRELAAALVERDCRVVLSARPSARLDALADELRGRGGQVSVVAADLADAEQARSLAARASEPFGTLRVLINNAGMEMMSPYHLQTTGQIDDVVNVNLRAAMTLTAQVLPGMLESGGGHVAMVSSLAAKLPAPYAALYSATKAGLIAFARSLRVEYRDTPVEFSVIVPGFVRDGGIYDRWETGGYGAPRSLGTVSMGRVVASTLDTIEAGSVERVIGSGPTKPLNAAMEVAPRLLDWLSARVARDYFRRLAARQADQAP